MEGWRPESFGEHMADGYDDWYGTRRADETTQHSVEAGVLSARGQISPPRGQPGWASTVLLLDPQGLPRDASAYEGIRLLIRVNKGNLSVSANSSEITNYDFHAAVVTRHAAPHTSGCLVPWVPLAQRPTRFRLQREQ